jgi:hypothetical protein
MKERGSAWVFIAGGFGIVAIFGFLSDVSKQIGPASIPIWFATVGAVAWTLRGPVGQALAKRIAGDGTTGDAPAELHEGVYAELDDLRIRVGELEERLDFSERLLAQRSQQEEGS